MFSLFPHLFCTDEDKEEEEEEEAEATAEGKYCTGIVMRLCAVYWFVRPSLRPARCVVQWAAPRGVLAARLSWAGRYLCVLRYGRCKLTCFIYFPICSAQARRRRSRRRRRPRPPLRVSIVLA